jgi:hypothetical protein
MTDAAARAADNHDFAFKLCCHVLSKIVEDVGNHIAIVAAGDPIAPQPVRSL